MIIENVCVIVLTLVFAIVMLAFTVLMLSWAYESFTETAAKEDNDKRKSIS